MEIKHTMLLHIAFYNLIFMKHFSSCTVKDILSYFSYVQTYSHI